MKKSKNDRKIEFLKRIQYKANTKVNDIKESEEEKIVEQEEPSKIAERILLKHLRGHIGKNYDDEMDR